MDKELKDFLDKKFSQVDENVDRKTEDVLHRFQIIAENLEEKIQQVVEGVVNRNEKMGRRFDETNKNMDQKLQDISAAIKFSYADLVG